MYRSVVFFSVTAIASSLHLPPHIPPCKSTDQSCLKSSVESAFLSLKDGNKELGIPALEPLVMNPVTLTAKPGPFNIDQAYTNIVLHGISKAKVKIFSVDLKKCHMILELEIPSIQSTANYEIRGHLLVFPVDSKGTLESTFKNFVVVANVDCEVFKNKDVEYLRATTTVTFKPDVVTFKMGNLINGNPQLEREVHKIIDDDPKALFEVIRPAAEDIWSSKINEIVNDFLTKVPTHELFKD